MNFKVPCLLGVLLLVVDLFVSLLDSSGTDRKFCRNNFARGK